MEAPKTLLEIVGAPEKKIEWNKAALVFIDFQKEYVDGVLALGNEGQQAVNKAVQLLAYARKQNVPVFHVVHHSKPNAKAFDPTTKQIELINDVKANIGEKVIIKSLPNSFFNTKLEALLALTGRKQLVVAGFMSHMCVTATVIKALELGYENFVCADTCASRALKYVDGTVLDEKTVHQVSMAALKDRYATVINCDELIN